MTALAPDRLTDHLDRPPMTTVTAVRAASIRAPFTVLNRRTAFLRFITLSNGLILVFLLLSFFIPDAPLGLLAPLVNDLAAIHPGLPLVDVRGAVVMGLSFLLFADISQSLRRLPPSYLTLATLSGQGILFLIAFAYTLTGRLPVLALYGIGGSFWLSVVGIVAVVQSYRGGRFMARALFYPSLSALMAFLGLGLILSPDTLTRQMIDQSGGVVSLLLLLSLLAWGSGQLRQNHLMPHDMIRRLIGMGVFPIFPMRLLHSGAPVSFLGIFLTLNVAVIASLMAFVQVEIERVERERAEIVAAQTNQAQNHG